MSVLSSSFLHKFNKYEKPFTPLVRNNCKQKFLFSKTILFFWALTGHFGALIHVTKRFESISRVWGISNVFIFISFCIVTIKFTIERDSATFASITQLLLWITNDIWCFCGLIVNIWHFKFTCLCGKVQIEYNGFKNYITFRNNIHQLNNYNINNKYNLNDNISQKEFISYIVILFISILLLNLLPFHNTWCDEATDHNYSYTVNSIIFQSIVTIWNNICSLYAFDVTLLYVSLLHIQRFRNFRREIAQNKYENNISIVRKQYYESIAKNIKISKHNWEFWVNGSFLFNSLYVSIVIAIWLTDKTQLWTWCHTNPIQISFVAGLSIIRIMALVYPIARINTEFNKITMTLQQYVGWDTTDEIQIDHIYAMKKLKLFSNLSKKYSINNDQTEKHTGDNNGNNVTRRNRLGSSPIIQPMQPTSTVHMHGYDSMNNSSILVLPHITSNDIIDEETEQNMHKRSISVSMLEEVDEENIIGDKNDEINIESLQALILKQMMDNNKIQRFCKELRMYPLGLHIIGLRMEWGYFKSIFATGIAILFTVWLRSRFNVTGI